MSGTQMKASLLLTLEDELSSGINRLTEVLDKLIGTTERVEGGFAHLSEKLDSVFNNATHQAGEAAEKVGLFERALNHLGEAAGRAGAKLDSVWAGMGKVADKIGALGGLAAGISVVAPVEAYADYENVLRHIAITEGLSGDKVKPEIDRLTKLFAEDAQRTGQSSTSIAEAYYKLITSGIPRDTLDKVIAAHSAAATAYNIDPDALTGAAKAFLRNFKIPEAEFGQAMSAMAIAAKEGDFKVSDFSLLLPGVSGLMSFWDSMRGRGGADYAFAALETIMKNSSEPNQAAAGFTDALRYISDNSGRMAFNREAHVDITEIEEAGKRAGKNPLDSILDYLQHRIAGQDDIHGAATLGRLLHNQQAGLAIMSLLEHRSEFKDLKARLDKVDSTTVARDFATALADPITQVRLFNENVQQITRTVGEGFTPALSGLTRVLHDIQDGLSALNGAFPATMHVIEAGTGVVLAFGAAIGLISLVAGGPVAVAIAAITALAVAADEIYAHWANIKAFFQDIWDSFKSGVDGAIAGVDRLTSKLDPGNPLYKPEASVQPGQTKLPGLGMPSETRNFGGNGFKPLQLNVHVSADPGLKVQTTSPSPGVTTTSPSDETRTVGRP